MNSSAPIWSSGPIRAAVNDGNRGEVVRLVRVARGLTQSQLGRRCGGYSASAISRLESGAQPLSVDMLNLIAKALEIPAELLLGPPPDRRPDERADARTAIPRPRTDSPAVSVPAQLPMDIPEFVGREAELRQLNALLVPHRRQQPTAVTISAISGTAGVGKTSLAVHWAHQIADRFSDGQLYVDLRGFGPSGDAFGPAEVMRGFLEALGVDLRTCPTDLDGQAALYRSLLSGKRMLIVLDNAKDTNQVRPLLPGAPGCLVIVTSRNMLIGLITRAGARPLNIDLLAGAEARQLLERRIGKDRIDAEPDAVDDIVNACAGLPLALAVVAAWAKMHPGFPLASLAADLQDSFARLDFLTEDAPDIDVRAVFSWSYHRLGDGAQRTFRLLGLHPGPDASAAAIASLTAVPLRLTLALLTVLTRAHLVTERTRGRFELHDLLRAYAAELTQKVDGAAERESATRRLLDHYLHSAFAADHQLRPTREAISLAPPQHGVLPEVLTDKKLATEWFLAEHRVLLAVLERAAANGFDVHAWQLAWALHTYLDRHGLYRDCAAAWQLALEATRRVGDRRAEARAHRMLVRLFTMLERHDEVRPHLRQALEILNQLEDLNEQGHTYGELARALERQHLYGEALGYAQQGLKAYRATGYRAGQARSLNDVGWLHAQLGQYEEALVSCEQALALHQQLGGVDDEANTWDSIGFIQHSLRNYGRAVECYNRALERFREVGYKTEEAEVLTHLGETLYVLGDVEHCREAWSQAADIFDEIERPESAALRAKLEGIETDLA
jgi:tetratricopeptide (TPR) repeat protein/transcriptional regulator with XRE-family HTH domain